MRHHRRIRIGNQTALSATTFDEPFDYAVRRGFDAFEWFPDEGPGGRGWRETDLPASARESIRRIAREHDIALSVHGSWQASPLTPAGFERLASQSVFAAEIGASVFVVHLDLDRGVEPFVEAVSPMLAGLARAGITLALENTTALGASDFNDFFRYLRRSRPRERGVGMCLDVGHANLCPETRNDYLAFVDRLDPEVPIRHVHLHENWGDADSHLTLFTGPAARSAEGVEALVGRLVARRFAGNIILEQWPDPPSLLDAARDRLVRLIAAHRPAGPTRAGPARL